jgi:hypothetical protein
LPSAKNLYIYCRKWELKREKLASHIEKPPRREELIQGVCEQQELHRGFGIGAGEEGNYFVSLPTFSDSLL